MAKYVSYQLATDCSDTQEYDDYRQAFGDYQRCESATLYGVDEFGEMSIIMAK